MPSKMLRRSSLSLCLACLVACGNPRSEARAEPQAVADEPDQPDPRPREAGKARPNWRRSAAPMPETFAGFPRPELRELDGAWVVEATVPHRAAVWLIEDEGSKLTIVDRHGQERVHGLTLASPCALRLTDDDGRAQTWAIAQLPDRLILSRKGAVAVTAADNSLLACVEHRTYQLAADGRCRYTTEMLGVWSEPVEATDACRRSRGRDEQIVSIAGKPLRQAEGGVWLDEVATDAIALSVASREAGLAVIAPKPAAAPEAAQAGSETGAPAPDGETGSG